MAGNRIFGNAFGGFAAALRGVIPGPQSAFRPRLSSSAQELSQMLDRELGSFQEMQQLNYQEQLMREHQLRAEAALRGESCAVTPNNPFIGYTPTPLSDLEQMKLELEALEGQDRELAKAVLGCSDSQLSYYMRQATDCAERKWRLMSRIAAEEAKQKEKAKPKPERTPLEEAVIVSIVAGREMLRAHG